MMKKLNKQKALMSVINQRKILFCNRLAFTFILLRVLSSVIKIVPQNIWMKHISTRAVKYFRNNFCNRYFSACRNATISPKCNSLKQLHLYPGLNICSLLQSCDPGKRHGCFQELQMVATFTTRACREPKLWVRLHNWNPSLLYINQQCTNVHGSSGFNYEGHLNQLSFFPTSQML